MQMQEYCTESLEVQSLQTRDIYKYLGKEEEREENAETDGNHDTVRLEATREHEATDEHEDTDDALPPFPSCPPLFTTVSTHSIVCHPLRCFH